MSKKMTPCEKLGYKVGDEFTLTEDSYKFSVGEVISLQNDDGTESPYFTSEKVKDEYPRGVACFLSSIKKVPKLKPAKQALADAIHQNGGWVVGSNFAAQDKNASVTFFVDKPWRCGLLWEADAFECVSGFLAKETIGNWHQCILSRDEYFTAYPEQAKVDDETRHKVEPEMKSESESEITTKVSDRHKNGELPPVGEVCEAYIDYPPQWIETEIVAHKDGFAIGWCKSVMKGCYGDKAHEFRPLRTERDKAIDEIISTAKKIGWNSEMASQIIGEVAAELYDAGYRKDVK